MNTHLTLRRIRLFHSRWLTSLRHGSLAVVALLLTACAPSPTPGQIVSAMGKRILDISSGQVDYGPFPDNYKKIVQDHLKQNSTRNPAQLDAINYLNTPNKFIHSQIMKEQFGYRVCAVVPSKDGRDLRSHFFLIQHEKVIAHLHDSGLMSLSDKFCDIAMLTLKQQSGQQSVVNEVDVKGFKYISCHHSGSPLFYAFNPEKQLLIQQQAGENIAEFTIKELTDTHIIAHNGQQRIAINRISGRLTQQQPNQRDQHAMCRLTAKQQF